MTDWLALAFFVFAAGITPGPNNIMLTTSGARFGFLRTIPHITGVAVGFPICCLISISLLDQIYEVMPYFLEVLSFFCILFLLWFAWGVLNTNPSRIRAEVDKPLKVEQAIFFQWVNPKVWMMILTVEGLFLREQSLSWDFIWKILLLLFCSSVFTSSTWAFFGTIIVRVISNGVRRLVFNYTMAFALLASGVYPLLSSY